MLYYLRESSTLYIAILPEIDLVTGRVVSAQTGKRRAPASHYVLAFVFGAVATIAVAFIVAATNPDDFWLAAGIGALCAAYPAFSLGGRMFVTQHTITRDIHGEESVEMTWLRRAAAGAFLDVLLTTVILAAVVMLFALEIEALPALLVLIGLSVADATVRYFAIRHSALK